MQYENFFKGYINALTIIPDKNFPKVDSRDILQISDEDALKKDWEEVGKDIHSAMRKLGLWFGFILTLTIIGLGFVLLLYNKVAIGTIFCGIAMHR